MILQDTRASNAALRPPPPPAVDPALFARHNSFAYRTPSDLQVTPEAPVRFLVVGGCLAQPFPEIAAMLNPDFKGDFILLNHFDAFPAIPANQVDQYAFQIIHIPLRSILGDAYFQLPDDAA